jgi:hypothetical protein
MLEAAALGLGMACADACTIKPAVAAPNAAPPTV